MLNDFIKEYIKRICDYLYIDYVDDISIVRHIGVHYKHKSHMLKDKKLIVIAKCCTYLIEVDDTTLKRVVNSFFNVFPIYLGDTSSNDEIHPLEKILMDMIDTFDNIFDEIKEDSNGPTVSPFSEEMAEVLEPAKWIKENWDLDAVSDNVDSMIILVNMEKCPPSVKDFITELSQKKPASRVEVKELKPKKPTLSAIVVAALTEKSIRTANAYKNHKGDALQNELLTIEESFLSMISGG